MPLWSELFAGYDKDEPFKPKCESSRDETRSELGSSLTGEKEVLSVSETNNSNPGPSLKSESRGRKSYSTTPRTLRTTQLTSSHDDTISQIEQTLQQNREKKSSTPKTPQTPKPPPLRVDPIEDDEVLSSERLIEKGAKVRLEPLLSVSASEADDSFSVDWKLDSIMEKSMKEFAQSVRMLGDGELSESVDLLENSERVDPKVTEEADPPGVVLEKEKARSHLNDSNPNPWVVVQNKKKKQKSNDELSEKERAKFQSHVNQIDDIWNDLVPSGDSLNLVDCSLNAIVTDCSAATISHEHILAEDTEADILPEDTEADILPEEYITSPNVTENDAMSDCGEIERHDNTNHHHDNTNHHHDDEISYQEEVSVSESLKEQLRMTGAGYQDISFDSNGRDASGLLAQLACNEDQGSVSTFQELQMLLASKDQAIEAQEFQIFELREALERAREDTKRLNMLNMIHIENAICKDQSLPTLADTGSSPILEQGSAREMEQGDGEKVVLSDVGVNTDMDMEERTNVTSLLARLNLEDSPAGKRNVFDDTLQTTRDLSLLDVTLTTGLSQSLNPDQALVINHLTNLQSEAMKIKDRSDELGLENERLHNQVLEMKKEMDVERGKLKNKIKEVMEERDKNKRLEGQLQANNEQHNRKIDELNRKLSQSQSTIKANKEIHKKKLEEVFAFHHKELEQLSAKQELSEKQAKGLAKLINVEPEKEVVSTDCQTSMIFSNFVLHVSTDDQKCPEKVTSEEENQSLKQHITQVEEEYLALKEEFRSLDFKRRDLEAENSKLAARAEEMEARARGLEEEVRQADETYARENQEKTQLINMTLKEKQEAIEKFLRMQGMVNESEQLLSSVVPSLLSSSDISSILPQDSQNDTVNFTYLSNTSEDQCPLPEATRYLVGVYKTQTEQVQDLTAALQAKDAKVTSLTSANATLSKQLTQAEAELDKYTGNMPDLAETEEKLLEANKTIAKLKGEILKLSTEAQNAHMQENGADETLIEENEELKNQIDKLEEIKATLLGDVQLLREQLDEEQIMSDQTAREVSEAHELIQQLQSEKENMAEDLNAAEDRNKSLESKIASMEEELASLKQKIKQEQLRTKELLEKVEDASRRKRERDELKGESEELQAMVDQMKSQIRRKGLEIEELSDTNASLQRKLNKLQPSLDSYEEENSKLKSELSSSKEELLKLEQENQKLLLAKDDLGQTVSSTLKQKLAETRDQLRDQEHELEEREVAIKRLTDELHDCKERLGTATEKAEKLEAAVEELQAKVNVRKTSTGCQAVVSRYDVGSTCHLLDSSLSPEIQQRYNELEQCYTELQQIHNELQRKNNELQRDNIEQGKNQNDLQTSYNELMKSRDELQRDCDKIKQNFEELQRSHDSLQRDYNDLQQDNRKTQDTCKDLEKNKEDLNKTCHELKSQLEKLSLEFESIKKVRVELESQLTVLQAQKATSDNFAAQLQQEHTLSLERLRGTLTLEKEEALNALRREAEADRQRREDAFRHDIERREAESRRQMEKVISDMEKKREQDCSVIARKVGLNPATLGGPAADSAQLTDRIEALHNQAVQIRNLALSFYEASHPPTREASVQAIVKMFKCSTQTSEVPIPEPVKPKDSLQDFIKVFKEEHDKQTEVLLKQLKTENEKPTDEEDLPKLRDEVKRLRLSLETYTTRCAMLEHNNRLLKDRNTGLENNLLASSHTSFIMADEDSHLYNSHVQRSEPRDLRKRLADCQKKIGELEDTVAEYEETLVHLEGELEREKEERKKAEKRMRAAESTAIEIKNDNIMARDEIDITYTSDMSAVKESCRVLEMENKKLKTANGKLRNLNNSLMESNKQLKEADSEKCVLNLSAKSNNLINEIDSLKESEDLRLELSNKETELARKKDRIDLLQSEIETKSGMISAQKDELESREKVIRLIKSELSAQQLDVAELKAMLDVERTRSDELERRLRSSDLRQLDDSTAREQLKKLRAENSDLQRELGQSSPSSKSRVTKAYLKFLRAESYRKALVFQKQYLLNLLSKARAVETAALSILEIKPDNSKKRKPRFKYAAYLVIASIRMRNLVVKWQKVRESLEEKQKRKHTPSCQTTQLTEYSPPRIQTRSPVPLVPSTTSLHSGYPKWDSSRPISPPSHPRDGLSSRVYGTPSPDPSLSRLDQQLARLRHTINTRAAYKEEKESWREKAARARSTARLTPERDISKPTQDEDSSGTLSDISNYISRLEAVQNRLTDLKMSSYKIYDSNKSLS